MGAYARDNVTWIQHQGLDTYGAPLTPVETPIQVRVEWKIRRVVNRDGEEAIAAGNIRMTSKPDTQDKIRIAGVDHIILAAEEIKAFSRILGYKVFIQ